MNILDFQNGRKTTKIREIDFLLIYWIFKINKKQQQKKVCEIEFLVNLLDFKNRREPTKFREIDFL